MATSRFLIGAAASVALHVLVFAKMHGAAASTKRAPPIVIEIENAPPRAPAPPPPPPAPSPEPAAPRAAAPIARSTAAPPPARAGKTLTASDDAPSIADFTMVQGTGTYAGGVTSSTGTSKSAVQNAAPIATAPAGGGGGAGPETSAGDASRRARPLAGDWDCKALFPAGASRDAATVTIVVQVRIDGRPERVSVVSDPGDGFGPAARACAMQQTYAPAQDRDGHAIAAATAPFRVRFTR